MLGPIIKVTIPELMVRVDVKQEYGTARVNPSAVRLVTNALTFDEAKALYTKLESHTSNDPLLVKISDGKDEDVFKGFITHASVNNHMANVQCVFEITAVTPVESRPAKE